MVQDNINILELILTAFLLFVTIGIGYIILEKEITTQNTLCGKEYMECLSAQGFAKDFNKCRPLMLQTCPENTTILTVIG